MALHSDQLIIHRTPTGHELTVRRFAMLGKGGVIVTFDVVPGDRRREIDITESEMDALVDWWLQERAVKP